MAQLQAYNTKGLTYHQAKWAKIATCISGATQPSRVTLKELAKFEYYEKGSYAWEFATSHPGDEFLTLNLAADTPLVCIYIFDYSL